jgi:hypothetical protein
MYCRILGEFSRHGDTMIQYCGRGLVFGVCWRRRLARRRGQCVALLALGLLYYGLFSSKVLDGVRRAVADVREVIATASAI